MRQRQSEQRSGELSISDRSKLDLIKRQTLDLNRREFAHLDLIIPAELPIQSPHSLHIRNARIGIKDIHLKVSH
jgi:hypothetical protein